MKLWVPESPARNNEKFVSFLLSHDWKKAGFVLEPQTIVTYCGEEVSEKTAWFDIAHPVLGTSMAQIDLDFRCHSATGNPGNMEEFLQKFIDELDEFYTTSKMDE